MTSRPEWDIDRDYGEAAEDSVRVLLGLRNSQIEVKHKRRIDDGFYVEAGHSPRATGVYVQSGINVSKADMWVYVIADTGVMLVVPKPLLMRAARDYGRRVETPAGGCPTIGRLVFFEQILMAAAFP